MPKTLKNKQKAFEERIKKRKRDWYPMHIPPKSEWMYGDWKHYGIKSKRPKRRPDNG